jgi:hypothetical protein
MSDNLNIDLKKFAENAKKIRKVKEDFDKCLNAEIVELELGIKTLFNENEQLHIYNQLTKLDLNSISVPKVGRLQTILDFVAQEYLDKYRNHFLTNNARKEFPEAPKRPEGTDKTVIKEFNDTVQAWQKEVKQIKDWNTKYNTLTEYLDSIITVDLYGDTTLNVTALPYVYFKFMNTDIDEIEVFIQELKTCPAPPVKKIKSIKIEDIKDKLPAFVKSAKEVRVYFDTIQDAEELHGSADYVGGVYEKYVIKNDLMKKDGGEWGIFNKRKDNLANPVVGGFSLVSAPSPVNLNSGQGYAPDEDFYNEDYEVSLTDCYYAEAEISGDDIFAIVPKAFWDKYKTILVNKKMTITGISDNSKFTRKEIYFMYMGDVTEGSNYISDEAEYSTELSEYLDADSQLSPFKRKLKMLLEINSFDEKDWIYDCESYNLTELQGFPDTEKLIAKLTPKAEMEFYKQAGVNSKKQYEDEIGYEDQDLENCDLVSLTDTQLEIRCGGDWQHPASITFGLKDGKIVVTDYHLEEMDNQMSSYKDEEDEIEAKIEAEEEEENTNLNFKEFVKKEKETIDYSKTTPKDCYWIIDYIEDDGEVVLNITPKQYWKDNEEIYPLDLNFNLVNNYFLEGSSETGYGVFDKNTQPVKSLHIIERVMRESGFEFSQEIQSELPSDSLNGFRLKFEDYTLDLYLNRLTKEFADYFYGLDTEKKSEYISTEYDDDVTYSSAREFVWSISVEEEVDINDAEDEARIILAIVPKDYWNKNQCMDDRTSNADYFIMKGYCLEELVESTYVLSYGNGKYVTKISEVILVLSKSGYEYSFDMQKWLDRLRSSNIDSNNFSSKEEYFDALKSV